MFSGRGIEIKTATEIGYLREAALVVEQIHQALWTNVRPGITPKQLDKISAQVIEEQGAHSNFYGYYDYPATVCISVNDTVVHGIPDHTPLKAGDLVSFDCGAYLMRNGKQWHGDSCFSIVVPQQPLPLPTPSIATADLGELNTPAAQLNALTRESMWAAIAALAGAKTVGAVGNAVEDVLDLGVQRFGWQGDVVEEFTGHGIGTAMHQPPDVVNFRARGGQAKLRPGMVLCIEPILTYGANKCVTLDDGWTVKTVDGKLACHWECQVAILPNGISVLNQPDYGTAGLAAYGVKPVAV